MSLNISAQENKVISNLIEQGLFTKQQLEELSLNQLNKLKNIKDGLFNKIYSLDLINKKINVMDNKLSIISQIDLSGENKSPLKSEDLTEWSNSTVIFNNENKKAGDFFWKDFEPVFGKDSVYPGTRFTDYNYSAGKAYDYEVQTVDIFGNLSETRAVGMVETPAQQVVSPGGITAFNLPDGIRIGWTAPVMDGLKGYKVYRYQRGKDAELIANISAGTTFYLDKTAKAGELYFYTLTAIDESNNESVETDEVGVRH